MGLNLHILWKKFAGIRPGRGCAPSPTSRCCPVLESLEERTLLSQTPVLPAAVKEDVAAVPIIRFQSSPAVVEITQGNDTQVYSTAAPWNATSGWAVAGGQGTFIASTENAGANALLFALADFNGDTIPDAVVSSPAGSYLTLSAGEGSLPKPSILNLPVSADARVFLLASGDFNGDQRTDVILVSHSLSQPAQLTLQVFLGRGDGTLLSEVDLKAGVGVVSVSVGSFNSNAALTVGDLNNDGTTDLMLSRSGAAGTTIGVLLGKADQSFAPSLDLAVPAGPFTLQISNLAGTTQVKAVPKDDPQGVQVVTNGIPQAPSSEDGATGVAQSTDAGTADAAAVTSATTGQKESGTPTEAPPTPENLGPVLMQASVPGTGLSVQVLVDASALPKGSTQADYLPEEVFWAQVVSAGPKNNSDDGDNPRSPANSTDTRPIATQGQQPVDAGAKSVATLGAASSAVAAPKSVSSSAKASDLAESLLEEAHDYLSGGNSAYKLQLGQGQVFQVASALAGEGAATIAAGAGTLPNIAVFSQALGLENKASFLLCGLQEQADLGDGLFLRFHPVTGNDDKSAASACSVLEIGKAVLQAMIIVKLTPGGSGPDKVGVPGVISTTDSAFRVAEVVRETSMFLTRLMRSFYQRYLGRDPENGEEQGWVNMLMGGDKEENVLSAFLTTRAFAERADVLIETGTPDEKYLQALYQLVLDRSPSAAEMATWLQGATGLDRQLVASSLVKSSEFRTQQIEEIYRDAFQRDATPEEIAQWTATPFDLMNLRGTFASLQERST